MIFFRATVATLLWTLALGAAADIQGRVIGVSDGDTVTVLDEDKVQHKIRLAGIDAPELRQAFGRRSKQTLSDCAFGKEAVVVGNKIDRYGRRVGKVVVLDNYCNLRQVELGLAWHYKAYEREQSFTDKAAYGLAEIRAQESQLGLWKDLSPQPPWDYRREKR